VTEDLDPTAAPGEADTAPLVTTDRGEQVTAQQALDQVSNAHATAERNIRRGHGERGVTVPSMALTAVVECIVQAGRERDRAVNDVFDTLSYAEEFRIRAQTAEGQLAAVIALLTAWESPQGWPSVSRATRAGAGQRVAWKRATHLLHDALYPPPPEERS
jgi:hypothetical protein